MVRLLDRYVWKELGPPFAIGVGVFTFFLIIDRIYQLTNLVITKNVPFQLVLSLLVFMLPAFLSLTLPMALLVAVLLVCGRLAGDLEVAALKAAGVSPLRLFRPFVVAALHRDGAHRLAHPRGGPVVDRRLPAAALQDPPEPRGHRHQGAHVQRAFGQFVIYVDDVSPSQLALRGIVVSDERDPQRSRIIVAREGRLLTDEANRRITLRFLDGAINETEAADPRRFRHTAFSLYDMTLPVESPLAAVASDEKPEKRDVALRELVARRPASSSARRRSPRPTTSRCTSASRCPWPRSSSCSWASRSGIRSHRGGRAVALASSFVIVVSYYILFTVARGHGAQSAAACRRSPSGCPTCSSARSA